MAKSKKLIDVPTHGKLHIDVPESGDITKPIKKYNPVSAKTPNQKLYIKSILSNDLVFASGPPGCGKTHLAVGMAVEFLQKGLVDKIIITRPAIEAFERIGFMPGNADEKLSYYIQPIYDELVKFVPREEIDAWKKDGRLVIVPMGFLRGRNLSGFIILDEGQNCTFEQLKLFLTRLCPNSKMLITGDPAQSDLPQNMRGAFERLGKELSTIEGIDLVQLEKCDITRHKLVERIVTTIENMDNPRTLEDFWRPYDTDDIGGW